MNTQLTLDFATRSKINIKKLSSQNKRLFDYLRSGATITMFEANTIGIGYLNSRVSDLRNVCKLKIYDRYIDRNGTHLKEYSLIPFN